MQPGRRLSLAQALDFQRELHAFVDKGVKPIELASVARAWCDLEERKRILRGKPLPGAYKPLPPAKGKPNKVTVFEG
jgi:hypothetical protein